MGVSSHNNTIAQDLEAIVGPTNVCSGQAIAPDWQRRIDLAVLKAMEPSPEVACMVSPSTVEELAEAVKCVSQQGGYIIPCGQGSKLGWGGLVHSNSQSPLVLISTERMSRLIEHAVGDLTVTVEAGMRFAELQKILAEKRQFLAIDPMYPNQATLGGIVATADTGSLRQRYNSVRDMLLGISFVRADGQVAKAGGRVVKNVAGYDLMKLLTGSFGTLGVISQVTFRVYPLPEASQTILLNGDTDALRQVASTLLSSALTPTHMDWFSVSLVSNLQMGHGAGAGLAVRFQSITASVQEQINKVSELGHALNLSTTRFEETDDLALWQRVEELTSSGTQELLTAPDSATSILCKIGICPSETVSLLQYFEQISLSNYFLQVHTASGLGKLLLPTVSLEQLTQIRAFCQTHKGFLSVLQAPARVKQQIDVWGYSGNALDVMRSIKQQFDSQNILSPHRFVGEI